MQEPRANREEPRASTEPPRDVEEARRLLAEISSREDGPGILVGVLLLPKTSAGELKKQFAARHGCKLGFRRVKALPSMAPFIVVHLSSRSASDVQSVLDRSSGGEGTAVAEVPFEFFPGVRMADPVFGFPELCLAPSAASLSPPPPQNSGDCGGHSSETSYPSFTFAEVFAGIGGFRLGLEGPRGLGGICAFASEIDEAARNTYELNFGGSSSCSSLLGDVSDLYAHQFPDHDILTGGFPCQSFSDRGQQKGLDDPRGQLYTELVRILMAKQPRAFLFENVASLVTMAGGKRNRLGESEAEGLVVGRTFATILAALEGCGYSVSHHMVDARHFLPQYRERVYITGFRSDLGVTGGLGWPEAEVELLRRAGVTAPPVGAAGGSARVSASPSTVRDILEQDPSPSLSLTPAQWARVQESQQRDREQLISLSLAGTDTDTDTDTGGVQKESSQQKRGGRGGKWRRLGEHRSREIDLDGKAPTLISGYRNAASVSTRFIFERKDGTPLPLPRFLSPRECCRLMGFPEAPHFQLPPVVDGDCRHINRFYKQIGNAVCPPVIRALGALLLQRLQEAGQSKASGLI